MARKPARHPRHDARVAVPDPHLAGARDAERACDTVIVDEIHAVAHSKRGAHLALTSSGWRRSCAPAPERLPADRPAFQRIGLSATQNPLEEIGRFLVGPGPGGDDRRRRRAQAARPADRGARRVDDRAGRCAGSRRSRPARPRGADPRLAGGEATRASIWPAIYPELLRLVREHTSTIVFVNNRRSAERVALRLNELAAKELEEERSPPPMVPRRSRPSRSRAPTTARSRARSARRSRSC